MLCGKKKHDNIEPEKDEENPEINFERIFLIARTKMGIPQREAELLTFGKWLDIFHEYKSIYNFETKRMLYKDIEDELKSAKEASEQEVSLASL